MIFDREALYALAFLTGSKHRIFGVPSPMDDEHNPMGYKEMITAGMAQLTEKGLLVDGKPTETCERLIFIMSEYMLNGNYLRVDFFHFATHGTLQDNTTYIEEVENKQYRLNSLMKSTMVAGIMTNNLFLAKLDAHFVNEWTPETMLGIQRVHNDSDYIMLEGIHQFKPYHHSVLIDNGSTVLEFDILKSRKRVMSSSSAVLLLVTLMNIREDSMVNGNPFKEADNDTVEY